MRNSKDPRIAVEADQDHLARVLCPMSSSFGGRQCSHRYRLLLRCSTRGKLRNEFTRTSNAWPDVGSLPTPLNCALVLGADAVSFTKPAPLRASCLARHGSRS